MNAFSEAVNQTPGGAKTTSPLLETVNLTHRYQRTIALQSLNMKLYPGRIVGLLGPNGSGKTTLLKILAGVLSEYQGEALINGMRPNAQTKAIVSYLPDVPFLDDRLRAGEALQLFARYYTDFNMGKAENLLRHFRLSPDQRIQAMSKGMREKLQVVLVMGRDAKVYLLDEPISGVDPASREVVLDAIISGYSENSLMLLSTHLIQDIERLLDDVIFIDQGSVKLAGEAEALRHQHNSSIDELFREVFKWSEN
ncbi:MAG: ABC transporter ATP-binding protein [Saccharofermentanales bacterium]|jgi:ABC-2 type transport system ATP-binding protein